MKDIHKGLIFVTLGAVFWGIGGTVSQKLFAGYDIPLDWFITIRLILSGLMLLTAAQLTGQKIFDVFKTRYSIFHLLIYSVFGMLAVQYTYLASIKHGNAAVATLLQYLAPIFILIFLLITRKTSFKVMDLLVIATTTFGTFLLLTNGDLSTVAVSKEGIFWGVMSGAAAAFYIMYANKLFIYHPSLTVIGWAMLIGGIVISFNNRHWTVNPLDFGPLGLTYFIFVVIFGTALAFFLYLLSVKYIDPQLTALLGCLEPLTAVILSIIWLGEDFGLIQVIGMMLIIGVVIFVSLFNNRKKPVR